MVGREIRVDDVLYYTVSCDVCGSGMYGDVNCKKHPDGSYYRDYFYYACKHRTYVNGHKFTCRKQWNEDKINAAVEEVIRNLVNNKKFKTEIQKHKLLFFIFLEGAKWLKIWCAKNICAKKRRMQNTNCLSC